MPSLSRAPSPSDEFPAGASQWPADLNRRDFLQLTAASFALAGLVACSRHLPGQIRPAVTSGDAMQESGEPRWFATSMPTEGFGRGILVRTNSGRPTKIEGNPDHPESLGGTDVFTQAAILSLYDPDRSSVPQLDGLPSTWNAFEETWAAERAELIARRGAGLAVLTEPTTSPTLLRLLHELLDVLPEARWFQHTPLARYDHDVDFDFTRADVILSLGSDCFYHHPAAVRYGAALAARRRVQDGSVAAPRFYALEPTPTVSGALADFRLPASPGRLRLLLNAITRTIKGGAPGKELKADECRFVRGLAADIKANPGRVACVVGPECDPAIHTWAMALNSRSGQAAVRLSSASRSDGDSRSAGDLSDLANAMDRPDLRALFVLGVNPAYTGGIDLGLAEKFRRVPFTVHLGSHVDETAALAHWHLPEAHFLESWSDLRGFDGTASILQPTIEPMYATRSSSEIIRLIASGWSPAAYDLVRRTWATGRSPADFDVCWHRWLDRGVVEEDRGLPLALPGDAVEFPDLETIAAEELTVGFQPDPTILDGRWANNAWLQELPKPLTHLVWENAALVSQILATRLALENGDVVVCGVAGAEIEVPVWIMPGQASDVITLSLGYGRTRIGVVGAGRGYDAYRLRRSSAPWHCTGVTIRKLGRKHTLVSTHGHFAMEGRDLVRVIAPTSAAIRIDHPTTGSSLYPTWRDDRYAWGMSIDLSACLGCQACVVACQAENNIPVVGKDQVARGREMHWLRIDRYYSGDRANPRFLHQPVPCMHCELAPCEVVCPVAATVHSSEGLNDMIYNRCIGTRYCSNNCPYKVRRFNFLDYHAPRDSTVYLQANPEVTVRERGIMEKCTYCVQRISAGRIAAEKENRAIRDGEIRTACQQACPAGAIVFGNLNDPSSLVARRKAEPTNYALLAELNTRPRTTYLAMVRQEALA